MFHLPLINKARGLLRRQVHCRRRIHHVYLLGYCTDFQRQIHLHALPYCKRDTAAPLRRKAIAFHDYVIASYSERWRPVAAFAVGDQLSLRPSLDVVYYDESA